MRFPIISRSLIRVGVWLVWMVVCAFLFFSNLRLSKQFTWWIEFKLSTTQTASQVKTDVMTKINDPNTRVTTTQWSDYINVLIQQEKQDETALLKHNTTIQSAYMNSLKELAVVWPSIGKQISSTAFQAIVRWLILMALFIIFEFSKIRKFIQPRVLAVITIFTMLFDILSPMGIYGIFMMVNQTVQVDVIFIIALLTTMGYSINDTIVVFDRVREHLEHDKNKSIGDVFEHSLWETMARSLMTSGSTLLVVIAMYALGTWDLKQFAFSMIFGILSGSFSSIFLAAPLAYLVMKWTKAWTK